MLYPDNETYGSILEAYEDWIQEQYDADEPFAHEDDIYDDGFDFYAWIEENR
jgi:hypothetical protein